jgi:hypothetical protein
MLVAAPGSAGATARQRCFVEAWIQWDSPGVLGAYAQNECANPEGVFPLNITLLRGPSSTGPWTSVATGRGHVAYRCTGTSSNFFAISAIVQDTVTQVNCF